MLSRPAWILLALTPLLSAHVGSPDIYLDAQAGPYRLFITVQPPAVIPGVAALAIRASDPSVRSISAVPVPLAKEGAQFAPVADQLKASAEDRQFYTGALWMMTSGSWQVRLRVTGAKGPGEIAVPVPAVAFSTKPMSVGLSAVLGFLMLLLVAGLVLIVGASVREAKLPAGAGPDRTGRMRARNAMLVTVFVLLGLLAFGRWWWSTAENQYRMKVYKPLQMTASLDRDGLLTLRLTIPEWMNQPGRGQGPNGPALFTRLLDDLIPDHDHLMHLYAIRQPGLDAVYHLHPELSGTGLFRLQLPAMQPGPYRLYGDVVHANGFPETMVASITVPAGLPGRPLAGDDAAGAAPPWTSAAPTTHFRLPDGYVMEWVAPPPDLHARVGVPFRFRLLDPKGQPAHDMRLYMGMPGHAAFVKTDGTTFAHIHPTGSVAMASYMMAQSQLSPEPVKKASMGMDGMDMGETPGIPNEVAFPYGLPTPGRYRIFVQMKHGNTVETGVFDAVAR